MQSLYAHTVSERPLFTVFYSLRLS